MRTKIRYELKKQEQVLDDLDGLGVRWTECWRDDEKRKTFVEQTENWWESVRTEAQEICRNGDVERGWSLLQEGVGEIANKCFKSANVPKKDYISDRTWNLMTP